MLSLFLTIFVYTIMIAQILITLRLNVELYEIKSISNSYLFSEFLVKMAAGNPYIKPELKDKLIKQHEEIYIMFQEVRKKNYKWTCWWKYKPKELYTVWHPSEEEWFGKEKKPDLKLVEEKSIS